MIYLTGDIHCPIDVSKLNRKQFPEQKNLTKDDYLIICGDVGLVWEEGCGTDLWWQKWFECKNFTTLFVDGNHENHDALQKYPIEIWNGGKVHRIQPSVVHLMRGQVFAIDRFKFFTMGGAESDDKTYRKEGISWWQGELPTEEEYEEALKNLDDAGWEIDYVLTHTAPDNVLHKMSFLCKHNRLTNFLFTIDQDIKYKHWYFGHFHEDMAIDEKHTVLFQNIIKLE